MMIRPFLRQRAKTRANLASRPPRRRVAHATDLSAASGFPAISQPPAACGPSRAARLRSTVRPAPGYPRFLVFSTWLLLKEKARHTKAPTAFSLVVLEEVRFCCLHLPRTYGNSPLADDTNPNVRSCCYSSGVEHSLGKGEAESSNLSSSTIPPGNMPRIVRPSDEHSRLPSCSSPASRDIILYRPMQQVGPSRVAGHRRALRHHD